MSEDKVFDKLNCNTSDSVCNLLWEMSSKGKKEKEHDIKISTDNRNTIVKVLLWTFEKISLFDYVNHGLATFTDASGV